MALMASLTVAGAPQQPYLLVRVTGDAERYERLLRRLQDRVDFQAHRSDGFRIAATGVDIDRNRVVIDLITKRADAEEYFRARYGAGVTTDVIATELTSPSCAGLFGYRPAADGMSITVGYEGGGGAQFDHFELVEYPDRVEVAVIVRVDNGPVTADSMRAEAIVPLSTPLGSRKVVSATTGRRLAVEEPPPPSPAGE